MPESTACPHLRESLASEYVDLSDEQLDFVVAEIYGPGVSAEDVEGFLDDLGRGFKSVSGAVGKFAKKAVPIVGRALPNIAQGAFTGLTMGGPIGAIAGAAAGGASGILSQSRNRTLRGIGGAVGTAGQLASSLRGGTALSSLANIALGGGRGGLGGRIAGAIPQLSGVLGGLTGQRPGAPSAGGLPGGLGAALGGLAGIAGGGSNANALIGMLSRPETLRAISSAAMGAVGRPNVMVGTQPVSVQSILGALGQLAGRAAGEAEVAGGGVYPDYYYAADGELAIDPADSEQRTDALLELFSATPPPVSAPSFEHFTFESSEPEYTSADAAADEWLLAEAWAENEEEEAYA